MLLIDEDTSATNFMIRDELMQSVVSRDSEPITPYIDRLRELYETYGISSIIVAGSSGSYFHKADHILQMRQYVPDEITAFAKSKAAEYPILSEKACEAHPLTESRADLRRKHRGSFRGLGGREDQKIRGKVRGAHENKSPWKGQCSDKQGNN